MSLDLYISVKKLGPFITKDFITHLKLVHHETVNYKALDTITIEGKHKQLIANFTLKMPEQRWLKSKVKFYVFIYFQRNE
jgi:hypothetical protein